MSLKVTAQIKGLERLSESLSAKPVRQATKKALNAQLKHARKAVNRSIKLAYTTRENPNRFARQKQSTLTNLAAKLWYVYAPHRLSWFETKQIKVTTGKRKQRVSSAKRGRNRFKKRIVAESVAVVTKVKILRGQPFKVVEGRTGFKHKGWLQDKKGHIFERDQKRTWHRGKRGVGTDATWTPLYGLSISQMAASKATAFRMKKFVSTKTLTTEVSKELDKVL